MFNFRVVKDNIKDKIELNECSRNITSHSYGRKLQILGLLITGAGTTIDKIKKN